MKKDKLCIIINKHKVIVDEPPKKLLSQILSEVKNVRFFSRKSLRDLIIGTYYFIMEYCDEVKKEIKGKNKEDIIKRASLTRFRNRTLKAINFIPKEYDKLINLYYELILSGEDKGKIRGL